MCEHSGKLIAWMDCELPADETAAIQRHLADCAECRAQLEKYEQVSVQLDAYCDAIVESPARPRMSGSLTAAASLGAAAAIALVLVLVWPRKHAQPPGAHIAPATGAALAATAEPAQPQAAPAAPIRHEHRAQRMPAAKSVVLVHKSEPQLAQDAQSAALPPEPMIQIAIPADDMFPPGAVPPGMNFAADLTIAPDGSADRLRLRPRLVGFERRTTKP